MYLIFEKFNKNGNFFEMLKKNALKINKLKKIYIKNIISKKYTKDKYFPKKVKIYKKAEFFKNQLEITTKLKKKKYFKN